MHIRICVELIFFCCRLQDVFKWQMKVEENVTGIETTRIVWSIKYERNSEKEIYLPSQSRLVSRINIRGREPEKLVAVLKVRIGYPL